MTTATLTNEQLASMSPWDIAEKLGIGFTGDMNPIQHGGFFYSTQDWESYGYASVVEFWEDPETGHLVVQPGTIHKLEGEKLESAFKCIGVPEGDENRANMHCQIEACRAWAGIEPEGTAYPYLKVFNLDTWKERNIWKSIRGWIEGLAG